LQRFKDEPFHANFRKLSYSPHYRNRLLNFEDSTQAMIY